MKWGRPLWVNIVIKSQSQRRNKISIYNNLHILYKNSVNFRIRPRIATTTPQFQTRRSKTASRIASRRHQSSNSQPTLQRAPGSAPGTASEETIQPWTSAKNAWIRLCSQMTAKTVSHAWRRKMLTIERSDGPGSHSWRIATRRFLQLAISTN